MIGQRTQHTFFAETVQTQDTARNESLFFPYPGYWTHLRKSLLRLLSVLRFNFKSLAIRR